MAKEDVADLPAVPPRKRRALQGVPDLWLALWASDEGLSRGDRSRAQSERERRRRLKPEKIVGLVIEQEGVTPQQLEGIKVSLMKSGASGLTYPRVPAPVHSACRALNLPITVAENRREVIRASHLVIAAPRTVNPIDTGVWELIRYARHRSTPSIIIAPDWRE